MGKSLSFYSSIIWDQVASEITFYCGRVYVTETSKPSSCPLLSRTTLFWLLRIYWTGIFKLFNYSCWPFLIREDDGKRNLLCFYFVLARLFLLRNLFLTSSNVIRLDLPLELFFVFDLLKYIFISCFSINKLSYNTLFAICRIQF